MVAGFNRTRGQLRFRLFAGIEAGQVGGGDTLAAPCSDDTSRPCDAPLGPSHVALVTPLTREELTTRKSETSPVMTSRPTAIVGGGWFRANRFGHTAT